MLLTDDLIIFVGYNYFCTSEKVHENFHNNKLSNLSGKTQET